MLPQDPRIDDRLARDIDAAENNELTAYKDSLGNWTIGRGHLLPAPAPGKSWAGFTILPAVSDRYFFDDLISAITFAQKLPEYEKCDTDCRRNALVEICFNMRGKWHEFVKARAALVEQNWQGVHDELLDSAWHAQVKGRAERIANYFLNGDYPNA